MAHESFDHLHAPRRQWWLVIVLGTLTLFCGSIGLEKYEHEHQPKAAHGLSPFYHAAQMLILHAPHFDHGVNGWIEAGRWFGATTLALGTMALFWQRLRREFRFFLLSGWTGHSVICGLGAKGFEIVRCLKRRDSGARVVVLDPQPDPRFAEQCEEMGVCVIPRDACEPLALQQARVAHAGEIVVATPVDETNLRIAAAVREQCSQPKPQATPCHVQMADINLRETVQNWIDDSKSSTPGCALHFFDVFDNEARRTLLEYPLDGTGISPSDPRSVHVVILGFGRMGRSVALRAARMGQFANRKQQVLRLSVVDRNANQQRERFMFRYPILDQKQVCDLSFHVLEVESLATRKLMERWVSEPHVLLHVFVAPDLDARALEVALRLRDLLTGHGSCTLRARFHSKHSAEPILKAATPDGTGIITFGMVEDACGDDAFNVAGRDALARAIHEQFIQRRQAGTRRTASGDPALRPWQNLPEHLRESNRQQADHIGIKLRAIGCELADVPDPRDSVTQFTVSEVEMLAEMEHARWNVERWLSGWRYGTPSNKLRRINEHLVPWEDLHDSIQEYDREAIRDIPQLVTLTEPPQKVVRAEKPLTA